MRSGLTRNWEEEHKKKLILVEEAANSFKSGHRVASVIGRKTCAVGLALHSRKEELEEVKIEVPAPGYDFNWDNTGW